MTDKTVAELMAMALDYGDLCFKCGEHDGLEGYRELTTRRADVHAALEQAIRRAVDWGEPAATVGPRYILVPLRDLELDTPLYARNKP